MLLWLSEASTLSWPLTPDLEKYSVFSDRDSSSLVLHLPLFLLFVLGWGSWLPCGHIIRVSALVNKQRRVLGHYRATAQIEEYRGASDGITWQEVGGTDCRGPLLVKTMVPRSDVNPGESAASVETVPHSRAW